MCRALDDLLIESLYDTKATFRRSCIRAMRKLEQLQRLRQGEFVSPAVRHLEIESNTTLPSSGEIARVKEVAS